MGTLKFIKAEATGNDFVIIDNRASSVTGLPALAKTVCDRRRSIGADGLLVVEGSKKCDFRMRIFNPDGSEARMCGNGSRCVALYAVNKKIAGKNMTIETSAGALEASVKGALVKVMMMEPKDIRWNLCLMIHKCPYKLTFVDTGVPHVIHFVKDLDKVDVKNIGSHLRNHDEFSPEGTNADFVEIDGKNSIKVRTYERGVEDETLACGTGSVASALISADAESMASPITVQTRSGEKLKVYFDRVKSNFKNIYLEGNAKLIYEGVLYDV